VVGGDGLIGNSLFNSLRILGINVCKSTRKKQYNDDIFLDLADDPSTWNLPEVRFDVVFICAAVSSIQKCELEKEYSFRINVLAPIEIAKHYVKQGVKVIFLSSNAVFDGSNPSYTIIDKMNPINEYGRQKMFFEKEIERLKLKVTIVRCTKVIDPNFHLFISWINDLKDNLIITPFSNLVFSPIYLNNLVKILLLISEKDYIPVAHISGSGHITYEFAARFFAKKLGITEDNIVPNELRNITPIPKYSSLDTSDTFNFLGIQAESPLMVLEEFWFDFLSNKGNK